MVDLAADIYRDFNTAGDPGSGAHKPVKSEIRAWGTDVEARLDDAEADIAGIPATMAATYLALSGGTLTGLLTTNGQVKFPATQNPSADANTLDDYEEGTFTPTLTATGVTLSYASQVGTYTKIGNRVFFTLRVELNTSGNTLAGNALSLAGFPFAAAASPSAQVWMIGYSNSTTSYVQMNCQLPASSTTATIVGSTAAAVTNMTTVLASGALHATNGSVLRVTGQYAV